MIKTGVTIALPQELKSLTSKAIPMGTLQDESESMMIALSGMGALRANLAANLLAEKGAKLLVSWGCCAGLTAKADSGKLILPSQIIDSKGVTYDCDRSIRDALSKEIPEGVEQLHDPLSEASVVLNRLEDKNELHQKTGAVAADMESAAIAKVAAERGIPFIAIRSVSDDTQIIIPSSVHESMKSDGKLKMGKFIFKLMKNPSQISDLMILAHGFKAAKISLQAAADPLKKIIDQ